jgi:hypothetical protein
VNEDVEEDLASNNNDLELFTDLVPSFPIKGVGTHCAADGLCLDVTVVANVAVLLEDQRDLVNDEKCDFSLKDSIIEEGLCVSDFCVAFLFGTRKFFFFLCITPTL